MTELETPFYADPAATIYQGHVMDVLAAMPEGSVDMVCTSPPYWGLRRYSGEQSVSWPDGSTEPYGLEKTIESYLAHTQDVLRAIRRVMSKQATLWWNIGDSYAASGMGGNPLESPYRKQATNAGSLIAGRTPPNGLKPLDMCLMPERVALMAQNDKEYIRLIKDDKWAAYIAGIIDGEGTIGIHRTNRAGGYVQRTPYIGVKMSDKEALEKIVEATGLGRVRENNDADTYDRRLIHTSKNTSQWRLEGAKAIKVIQEIYPWLLVKRRQAKIAYELWRVTQEKVKSRGNQDELTDKEKAYRDRLWGMMKGCNQRHWQGDVPFNDVPRNFIDYSWYVRSVIIWNKPNPMPESVAGWRWERCKVKVKDCQIPTGNLKQGKSHGIAWNDIAKDELTALWQDCPGCPKCAPNDGLVLRRGSWRPTSAYEEIIMLAKTADYFADGEGVKEAQSVTWNGQLAAGQGKRTSIKSETESSKESFASDWRSGRARVLPNGRNLRDVWTFPTSPYPGAHFATFSPEIPKRCILAGTSEGGYCSECGMPWARVVESNFVKLANRLPTRKALRPDADMADINSYEAMGYNNVKSLGFRPSCACHAPSRPGLVLDPFAGSGTTLAVAKSLGRHSVGIELSADYCRLAVKRLESVPLPMELK